MKKNKIVALIMSIASVFVFSLTFLMIKLNREEKKYFVENSIVLSESDMIDLETFDTGASSADISEKGGMIYVAPGATFTLKEGTVIDGDPANNVGRERYGGGIYVSAGATFVMEGGTISNCCALYGGAIYVELGGKCYIQGGTIENCFAERGGYAVYIEVESSGGVETVSAEDINDNVQIADGVIKNTNVFGIYDRAVSYVVDGHKRGEVELMDEEFSLEDGTTSFNHTIAPLSYEECMGWFKEDYCLNGVEDNDDLLLDEYGDVTVYSREATLDHLDIAVKNGKNAYIKQVVNTVETNPQGVEIVFPREYRERHVVSVVDTIGKNAFNGAAVSNVHMPETITTFEHDSFTNIKKLSGLYIRKNVSEMEKCGISSCPDMMVFAVAEENTKFSVVDNAVIEKIDDNNKMVVQGIKTSFSYATQIEVPEEPEQSAAVTFIHSRLKKAVPEEIKINTDVVIRYDDIVSIAPYAFYGCTEITSVTISKDGIFVEEGEGNVTSIIAPGITKIGNNAFQGCTSLRTFTCTTSVSDIDDYAFDGCSSLVQVLFDPKANINEDGQTEEFEGVKTIGNCAFRNCSSLKVVDIGNAITSIEYGAFMNCGALINFNFTEKNNLEIIYGNAFSYTGLEKIELPSSVTNVGSQAFSYCVNAKKAYVPSSVQSYNIDTVFVGCSGLEEIIIESDALVYFHKDDFGGAENLKFLQIPCNVYPRGLNGAEKLETVYLNTDPQETITIREEAFKNCVSLKDFNCSSVITDVGKSAFYGSGITDVSIDVSATETSKKNKLVIKPPQEHVGLVDDWLNKAFFNCKNLENVYMNCVNHPIGRNIFGHECNSNCEANCGKVVPIKNINIVGCGTIWSGAFENIECNTFSLSNYNYLEGVHSEMIANDGMGFAAYYNEKRPAISGNISHLYLGSGRISYRLEGDSITANIEHLHILDFYNWCETNFIMSSTYIESVFDDGETWYNHFQGYTPMWYAKRVYLDGSDTPSTKITHPAGLNTIKSHTYQGPALQMLVIPSWVSVLEAAAIECENLDYIIFEHDFVSPNQQITQFGSGTDYRTNYETYHNVVGSPIAKGGEYLLFFNQQFVSGDFKCGANCSICPKDHCKNYPTLCHHYHLIYEIPKYFNPKCYGFAFNEIIDWDGGKNTIGDHFMGDWIKMLKEYPDMKVGDTWLGSDGYSLVKYFSDGSGVLEIENFITEFGFLGHPLEVVADDVNLGDNPYRYRKYYNHIKHIIVKERLPLAGSTTLAQGFNNALSVNIPHIEVLQINGGGGRSFEVSLSLESFEISGEVWDEENNRWKRDPVTAEKLEYIFISKDVLMKNGAGEIIFDLSGATHKNVYICTDAFTGTSVLNRTAAFPSNWPANWYYTDARTEEEQAYHLMTLQEFEKMVKEKRSPLFVYADRNSDGQDETIVGVVHNNMLKQKEVAIPEFVTEIAENSVVTEYRKVKKLRINAGTKVIGANAFSGLTGLLRVYIPSSVTTIDKDAFSGCSSLIRIYTNASSKPSGWAFTNDNIVYSTNLVYFDRIDNFDQIAEDRRFDVEVVSAGKYRIMRAYKDEFTSSELIIPNGVVEIESSVFENFNNLITLNLNEVEIIGNNAFNGCTNLVSVNFGSSLKEISDKAFYNFTNLKIVDLGGCKDLKRIGNSAFAGCISLELVHIAGVNDMTLERNAFNISPTNTLRIFFVRSYRRAQWDYNQYGPSAVQGSKREVYYGVSVTDFLFIKDCKFSNMKIWFGKDIYPCVGEYNGSMEDVTIPSIFKGVDWLAFSQYRINSWGFITKDESVPATLKSLNFGRGVEYVAPLAFFCNWELTKVFITRNVKTLYAIQFVTIMQMWRFKIVDGALPFIGGLEYLYSVGSNISPFLFANPKLTFYTEMSPDELGYIEEQHFHQYYYNFKTWSWEVYLTITTPAFFDPIKRAINGYCWFDGWDNTWPFIIGYEHSFNFTDKNFTWNDIIIIYDRSVYWDIQYNKSSTNFPHNMNSFTCSVEKIEKEPVENSVKLDVILEEKKYITKKQFNNICG